MPVAKHKELMDASIHTKPKGGQSQAVIPKYIERLLQ